MSFTEYTSRDQAYAALATRIAADLRAGLAANDTATLAVPGGTTPGPIFDVLSAADLPWDRVQILLTDERWVPEGHARSNAGLLKSRLLVNHAAAAQFHPYFAEGGAEAGVAARISQIAPLLPVTSVLLGMGTDMHTASLFPGAPELAGALADDAPALILLHPGDQPEARVSLSAPVLNGAAHKHLVIFGPEKRAAFERAQSLPAMQAPIAAVMDDLTIHWAE